MNSKSDIRLTELERRLAHHERMTEDLSEILAKQTCAVDELSQRLHRLAGPGCGIGGRWWRRSIRRPTASPLLNGN